MEGRFTYTRRMRRVSLATSVTFEWRWMNQGWSPSATHDLYHIDEDAQVALFHERMGKDGAKESMEAPGQ